MISNDIREYIRTALIREGWSEWTGGVRPASKERVKRATAFAQQAEEIADRVYGGVYSVTFHSIGRTESEHWVVRLHSPTGPTKHIYRDKSGKWFYSSGYGEQSKWIEVPPGSETIKLQELRSIIRFTVKTILNEMRDPEAYYRDAADQEDEYEQMNRDLDAIKRAGLGAKYEALMKGIFNLPLEEFDRRAGAIAALTQKAHEIVGKTLKEMTTTSDVSPINLPGNVTGGWVSKQGGSKRGVAGSRSLGYELTPIGKEEMKRKQDPV